MPPKNNVNPDLDPVIANPSNRMCADCDAKAPRWASVNLGILVCIDCSGSHRNMGTHISVVKSATLDKWQPKWITTVAKIGNKASNAYYETNIANGAKPRESDSLEKKADFVRRKYDTKSYAPRNNPSPSELYNQGRDPHVYLDGDSSPPDDASDSRGGRRPSRQEDTAPRRRGETPPRRGAGGGPPQRTPARPEPAPAAAPAPKPKPAPAPAVDLLDMASPAAPPPAAAAKAPAPQQPPQQPQVLLPTGLDVQQHPTAAAAPQGCGGCIPDLFAQQQAQAQAQAQQVDPERQQQDNKVDAMKNALSRLYSQPSICPYATIGGCGIGAVPTDPFQQQTCVQGTQGPQQPGLQQQGLQHPGMQQGMHQPGMQGMHGIQQPGMQQPGLQQPGMQQQGMQYGMQQPGMQQHPMQGGMPGGMQGQGCGIAMLGQGTDGYWIAPNGCGGCAVSGFQTGAPAQQAQSTAGPPPQVGAASGLLGQGVQPNHADALKNVLNSLSACGIGGSPAASAPPQAPASPSSRGAAQGGAKVDAFAGFGALSSAAAPPNGHQQQMAAPPAQQQATMGMQMGHAGGGMQSVPQLPMGAGAMFPQGAAQQPMMQQQTQAMMQQQQGMMQMQQHQAWMQQQGMMQGMQPGQQQFNGMNMGVPYNCSGQAGGMPPGTMGGWS